LLNNPNGYCNHRLRFKWEVATKDKFDIMTEDPFNKNGGNKLANDANPTNASNDSIKKRMKLNLGIIKNILRE